MVRVRFAPSPTGHLHVGNAKTALFNWFFARKYEGSFILRMEDTDMERSDAAYERSITEDLAWLGIAWDEGPLRQSERLDIYRSHALSLLEKGLAYRCFCGEEELAAARQSSLARGEPPRYNGKCRDLSAGEASRLAAKGQPFTLRFRSDGRPVTFRDGIRGELSFPRGHVDDLIILRRDGTPTYNLAVVVDDMLMGITHVIRGGDHISNTPRQMALINALGGRPPEYAHHSLLIGPDRKPLSKRHGATRVTDFRAMGIVSEALVNYLSTMGRNVAVELMDPDEIVRTFSLDSVSGSDNIFDMEKLLWFNREYLKRMPPAVLADRAGIDASRVEKVSVVRENASTLTDLREYMEMFDRAELRPEALRYLMKMDAAGEIAKTVRSRLAVRGGVTFDELTAALTVPVGLRKRDLFMILRAFVTGRSEGPPLRDVFPLVPLEVITGRIDAYLEHRHEG
ncbi:MAG: Glutamate--tRNA ligase 1 [Syntrophorhabdus sp. PtaB.Bin184]|jgi:nondiscriminating glutamyl-tRNA synthetase|nr:MAG: Glutamate--tRNA ligase 1 [Syntrophorhabdus sp. PtaB.Bin184]